MVESLKNLLGHAMNYGLGSVLPQLIGFLLIPLYTRFLSPTDYGILEMVTTLALFLTPLMKLGIPGSVTRFYYEYKDDENQLKNFITTINRILNYGAIILSSILGLFLYFLGEGLLGGLEFWPYMVIALAIACFSANNQLQKKLIQNRLQSRLNLILQVIFAFTNIGLTFLLVVVFELGALGSILASAVVTIAFYFQALYYLRKDLNGSFSRHMAKESINYGIGILPHHMAHSTGPLITKAILANVATLAVVGVFSISLRFVSPLILVCTSLNTVLVPLYNASRKKNEHEKIHTLIRQILLVSFAAYTIFVLLMPFIMKWSLPVEYHPAIPMIPILAIAFFGRTIYHISVAEIFYQKKTKVVSIITISGLLINIALCYILVQPYGSIALCWAFSASFLVWAIIAYLYKRKVSNYPMFNKELFLFAAGSIIITFGGFWIIELV